MDVQVIKRHEQFIHCSAQCRRTQVTMQITVVYGLYTVVARRPLWDGLAAIGTDMTQPWMCIGDYNSYLKPTDKAGGI